MEKIGEARLSIAIKNVARITSPQRRGCLSNGNRGNIKVFFSMNKFRGLVFKKH
jgi:hypothetical protein